ncbi:type IV toxin-antitoxin system AbiEi family antitoxin domain-containing protein [Geodermatophilus ruber]|uniref:Transcriptional regulator, AbiEi antitoxin, Type IV TA system n=1 Tax=Geodermatophilus ruber TaxID=504800 RepID=A0A1I4FYK5_9ACTN|nr:type IV toxin-antitoxin system AbiEi family antitoxin domain-containing protein [Geodermatophilus ruber]SFL22579.1 Transcriptional regulator, AbiEi antitoxin, Type IV TA system [Geodermatophilus ruber]
MSEPADSTPALLLRRDAVGTGWSDDELARLVRAGDLVRLRRGAYVDSVLPAGPAAQHRLLVRATMAGLRRSAIVSHQSAAVLLGLPLWDVALDRVHVTRQPRAWDFTSGVVRCHVARIRDDEIVEVDGLAVTSPVRTALDLARSLPHEAAVVALDAALHAALLSHDELRARLFDVVGTPGSRSAARAVADADARSESVGESRSRVILHRWKLAPSALQFEVRRDGLLIARTDFAWEDERLVGEFDGRIKYGRLLRPGQDPGDAVFAEKRREDGIRDEDWSVTRWVWAELQRPHRLAAKVRRARERARSRLR